MAKFITTVGYCSTTKKPFGIQFRDDQGVLVAVGSFATFASGEAGDAPEYSGKMISGKSFKCKHCQNDGIIQCGCGTVLCIKCGAPTVVCPKCGRTSNVRWVDVDELGNSKVTVDKQ
ncbi:MAG: hypothetical protein ACI4QL_02070 [Candidatus Fimimonas sp.]